MQGYKGEYTQNKKNNMKTLLITFAALTLFACSPIKRHQRLVERHPYVHTEQITTVHDTIEVIVPQVKVDTVTSVNFDTVIIERDRLRVQLIRVRDSIFIDAECKADTITVTRTIEVPTYASAKPKENWFSRFISFAWIVFFFVLLLFLFRRK
jgi:hypothetical protein